jgi:predicted transcriptional regulator
MPNPNLRLESWDDFKARLLRRVRGEGSAAHDARGSVSVESPETLVRLMMPENHARLGLIRDGQPDSSAELAPLSQRVPPKL